MPWDAFDIDRAEPLSKVGFTMIGQMVRRRRLWLGLTQRELEMVADLDQTIISRLENGRLRGLTFSRLAWLVGAMGGLDEHAPIPPDLVDRKRWWRRPP